jgi:hypothetical protein
MKQMYYILGGIAIIAVICFIMTGCDKKENIEQIIDDKVSVDKTELIFTEKDESIGFNVSCDEAAEWYLEAEGLEGYFGPNMADIRDFTIEPTSGKGKIKVSVKLRNELTESYVVDLKVVGKSNQVVVKLKVAAN